MEAAGGASHIIVQNVSNFARIHSFIPQALGKGDAGEKEHSQSISQIAASMGQAAGHQGMMAKRREGKSNSPFDYKLACVLCVIYGTSDQPASRLRPAAAHPCRHGMLHQQNPLPESLVGAPVAVTGSLL